MGSKGKLSSILWKGLFTLLPLYLTFYFLLWLISSIESTFSVALKTLFPSFYFPGMGLLSAIVIIFFIGLLMQNYIAQYLTELLEKKLNKLPVIGELYSSIESITKYLSSGDDIKGKEVVMVHFKNADVQLIGIVTRKDFSEAPKGVGDESLVSVYLPMSYQIGGFTVYVPKDSIHRVEMSQKQALKWALIGGIKEKNNRV